MVLFRKSQANTESYGYDLFTHRHNFAVWAAARAAQRGLDNGTNKILKEALEKSGIVGYILEKGSCGIDESVYDEIHRRWCGSIIETVRDCGSRKMSYGRAAKLVGIYLKVMVVLSGEGNTRLADVAHPPIDSDFLKNLVGCERMDRSTKKYLETVKWTKLGEEEYFCLIDALRCLGCLTSPYWKIERYWVPSDGPGVQMG